MYPVDLLKVRLLFAPHGLYGSIADLEQDENPNYQPLARRSVQRHIERHGHNIESGGLHCAMEGAI